MRSVLDPSCTPSLQVYNRYIAELTSSQLVTDETSAEDIRGPDHVKFQLSNVSISAVKKIVGNMANKAGGREQVTVKLLKSSLLATAATLIFLINSSISRDYVPASWKEAIVVPIHKAGQVDDPKNFRPISLLPVVSKVAERVVHQQLMAYLETHKLITDYQFGFRPGRSTEMTLLSVTAPILQGMKGNSFLCSCLFDLRKAFDCMPQDQLL